ncbi:MAG: hypothetical protein NWF01_10380 [Candidatus Bathyarchaeota archaeon]|nr:hypothetical protein [Candidatus Bathyarchaeota archaeon]
MEEKIMENNEKNLLRSVPPEQGFHFYRDMENCTEVTSYSLEELCGAISYVCNEAILFHFERGDFQNWIRNVIGDDELAQSIDEISACSRELSAQTCREELSERISIRISQLQTSGPPFFSGKKGYKKDFTVPTSTH